MVRPVALKVCGLYGVPSWLTPSADATVTLSAVPAVPVSLPSALRYTVGDVPGSPGGVGVGVGVGVGLGSVPPGPLPPVQVWAPAVTVLPAGTRTVVPSEKCTVVSVA